MVLSIYSLPLMLEKEDNWTQSSDVGKYLRWREGLSPPMTPKNVDYKRVYEPNPPHHYVEIAGGLHSTKNESGVG